MDEHFFAQMTGFGTSAALALLLLATFRLELRGFVQQGLVLSRNGLDAVLVCLGFDFWRFWGGASPCSKNNNI